MSEHFFSFLLFYSSCVRYAFRQGACSRHSNFCIWEWTEQQKSIWCLLNFCCFVPCEKARLVAAILCALTLGFVQRRSPMYWAALGLLAGVVGCGLMHCTGTEKLVARGEKMWFCMPVPEFICMRVMNWHVFFLSLMSLWKLQAIKLVKVIVAPIPQMVPRTSCNNSLTYLPSQSTQVEARDFMGLQ